MEKKIVDKLYERIIDRKRNPIDNSYTCRLFEKGKNEILKKVGEETVEVIIASMGESRENTISELTDLVYHTLVLMAEDGISPDNIYAELEKRFSKDVRKK